MEEKGGDELGRKEVGEEKDGGIRADKEEEEKDDGEWRVWFAPNGSSLMCQPKGRQING